MYTHVRNDPINLNEDLVAHGLNKSTTYLYGAPHDSQNLGMGGPATAQSNDNSILLGESFYSGKLYKTEGGDQVSTLIHEMGQLGLIAVNVKHIADDVLSIRYLGYNSWDAWCRLVRSNCGPK